MVALQVRYPSFSFADGFTLSAFARHPLSSDIGTVLRGCFAGSLF